MTILGRSEELVSRCVECDLAEPESLASLGRSARGVVDGILSEANEPKYCHPTLKRGQVTHQKCPVVQPHEASNLSTTRSNPLAMDTMHTPPAPPVPVWFPPKGSILSPEWTHAITTIMGHPLSSESGKSIQKWILYHAIQDPIEFWHYWDPTDPYDIKLLQEYVGSNGSVLYLPSSTIKSLISLWNYMNLLIKKGKSVDEKSNAQYFFQDDEWFNLTAHDMKRTLVNAGMKYHRPQVIPGTSLPNSTSPPSPAPKESSIHLELTPCDSTSTTTSMSKTCLLNTSCDHQLHLDHQLLEVLNLSLFLILKTYFSWIPSVSHLKPHAILKLNLLLNSRDNWMTSTRSLLTLKAQSQPLSKLPRMAHTTLSVLITQWQSSAANTLTLVTTLHYPNFWHTTSQVKKSNHTNLMALPYPPDPGEHVIERSATPTALVERDKLDPSSLAPPKGEMESSFSWTYLFKSPTSSTLCFGEPTLRKLTQVKLLCNPISSIKHTPHVIRVSD